MKRVIILLSILAFASCSSDDDNANRNAKELIEANDIVGKWFLHEKVRRGVKITVTDCDKKDYIMVTADLIVTEEGHSKIKDGVCVTTVRKSDKDNPPVFIRVSNTKYQLRNEPNELAILESKTRMKRMPTDIENTYEIYIKR